MGTKLRVFQTIADNNWRLEFRLDDITTTDRELIAKYGDPEINVGGTFLASTANEFSLPAQYVKLSEGFPYVRSFDATTAPFDTNTKTKVEGYRTALVTSITDAITALRANSDTYTSELIYNL